MAKLSTEFTVTIDLKSGHQFAFHDYKGLYKMALHWQFPFMKTDSGTLLVKIEENEWVSCIGERYKHPHVDIIKMPSDLQHQSYEYSTEGKNLLTVIRDYDRAIGFWFSKYWDKHTSLPGGIMNFLFRCKLEKKKLNLQVYYDSGLLMFSNENTNMSAEIDMQGKVFLNKEPSDLDAVFLAL